MTKLEEIKNQVAKELTSNWHPSMQAEKWDTLLHRDQIIFWPVVCKRYASDCCKATLEKASDNADSLLNDWSTHFRDEVDKHITDDSNICIL